MDILDQQKVAIDIKNLVDYLDKSQWNFLTDFNYVSNLEIKTRNDLKNTRMNNDIGHSKTSGSTGEPVTVGKSYRDFIWYNAASIREIKWLNWDVTKNIAIIKAGFKLQDLDSWGIPHIIEPIQGKRFTNDLLTISELQKWLEEKNPHYIHCFPSIFKQLDISKIPNFIAWKGTGEKDGSCYSSEECGIIALICPDNPDVYHVMENQIVEVDTDGSLIITTRSNKYIRRYKHGDHIELGECNCGRTLQTIKKIQGRVRNMLILPNGEKKWPQIGALEYESFGIKRFKMIQTKTYELELNIISEPLGDREFELVECVRKWTGYPYNVLIRYVESFPNYKFEEFVCNVK